MTKIICVGACYIDTILTVPHFPSEDSKLRATNLQKRRGGNCPNTLEVLQQLVDLESPRPQSPPSSTSSRAAVSASTSKSPATTTPSDQNATTTTTTTITKLILLATLPSPSCPDTTFILNSLGPKINTTHCFYRPTHPSASTSYIIRAASRDSRTIINHAPLPEMTVEEFIAAANACVTRDEEGGCWFHFEGRIPETTGQCVRYVRAVFPKAKVSVEVEKPGREGLEEVAEMADVVFYSRAWAEGKGFATPRVFLEDMGAKLSRGEAKGRSPILFCTWGALGATSWHNGIVGFAQAPFNVRVVDSVGAGDSFIAGVLFSLALRPELTVSKALQLGTIVAGEKVRREGFQGLKEALADYVTPWGIT